MVERIVLYSNLKFLIDALSMNQRGEILTSLFEGEYQGTDNIVKNVYQYLAELQSEANKKYQKMREMGIKSGLARRRQKRMVDTDVATSLLSAVEPKLQRKETKENNKNLNKNIRLFSLNDEKHEARSALFPFKVPKLQEVKDYISEQNLAVDAETFINFYESRGWKTGSVPMRNWQATLRLWHTRSLNKSCCKTFEQDDEQYWHELLQRVHKPQAESDKDNIKTCNK